MKVILLELFWLLKEMHAQTLNELWLKQPFVSQGFWNDIGNRFFSFLIITLLITIPLLLVFRLKGARRVHRESCFQRRADRELFSTQSGPKAVFNAELTANCFNRRVHRERSSTQSWPWTVCQTDLTVTCPLFRVHRELSSTQRQARSGFDSEYLLTLNEK